MSRIAYNLEGTAGTISAQPCTIALVTGFNNAAGPLAYFMLFNLNALPVLGAVPVQTLLVPAGANFSYAPSALAAPFTVGCVWAISSTSNTYTAAAITFKVHAEGNTQ